MHVSARKSSRYIVSLVFSMKCVGQAILIEGGSSMSAWPSEQLAVEQAFLRRYLSYKAQGLANANDFFLGQGT